MSNQHILDRIRTIDRLNAQEEDHIAAFQVTIGNRKRERAELLESLTEEERASLNPAPPAAEISSPEQAPPPPEAGQPTKSKKSP